MAYGRRSSFYTGGGKASAPDPDKQYNPKVDKNPYYRTMDILNGVFKKNIKLLPGKCNSTDGKVIFVNFGETRPRKIIGLAGDGRDIGHSNYLLECQHEWEGRAGHPLDGSKYGMCWYCGADQSYLGFEHEWQHIIFKSDLVARALFVDVYTTELMKTAPHVDPIELKHFLSFLVNAFDDIRCNSLWEKVYPGSAQAIWERWKRLTYHMGNKVNEDFMAFVFAVAFNIPTDPNGEFEPMRPVVEWGVNKVKYRGFGNMLIDVRAVLDRCMGAILAKVPPPPPKMPPPPAFQQQPQAPPPGSNQGNDNGDQEDEDGQDQQAGQGDQEEDDQDGQGQQQAGGQGPGGQEEGDDEGGDQDQQQAQGSAGAGRADADAGVAPPSHIPSASSIRASGKEKSDALAKMMASAQGLDDKEDHPDPSAQALSDAMGSQALKALMGQVLGTDISDLDQVDDMLGDDEPDQDMAAAIQQLQNGLTSKSNDSLLTANAKAKIVLIDVTAENVKHDPKVDLTEDERFGVTRMRSAFFKALGRQKAKRSPDGNTVDVPSLIQFMQDRQDPDVFESEAVQQGFAYSIVCDMSGSMHGTFPSVCHAVEMLKQSLKFPFVMGNLWGFRGGTGDGEVWMYRYAKNCTGYTGKARATIGYKQVEVPVQCGGLTPMHSALNVSVQHIWKQMPSGMAKRMFLLTDGSPMHTKMNGGGLPAHVLQSFVAKEIALARQHGIQVYTLIIGAQSISDDECKKMFGPSRYWKKTEPSGPNSVDKVLTKLVLENFTKYIKGRG